MILTSFIAFALSTSTVLPSKGDTPVVIYENGVIAGVGYNARGGWRLPAVDSSTGASMYTEFRAEFTPLNNIAIFSEAMEAVSKTKPKPAPKPHVWDSRSEVWMALRVGFGSPAISQVGFPELDAAAKTAAFFTIGFECTDLQQKGTVDFGADEAARVKSQKMWLPSNFKVSIDGLPTTHVSAVSAFTMKPIVDFDGDGIRDFTATTPISFVVPFEDVSAYNEWFSKALSGSPDSRTMTIEYQDSDGQPLITIAMPVTIESLGYDDIFSSNATLKSANLNLRVGVKQTNAARGINSPNLLL